MMTANPGAAADGRGEIPHTKVADGLLATRPGKFVERMALCPNPREWPMTSSDTRTPTMNRAACKLQAALRINLLRAPRTLLLCASCASDAAALRIIRRMNSGSSARHASLGRGEVGR